MSTTLSIKVLARTLFGNQAKKLYRTGLVPATIYGFIKEPTSVELSVKEFAALYKEAGETHVISLELDGKTIPAMVVALDIHPVTRKLRNIDFKAVNLKAATIVNVPVKLEGEAPVVKTDNGIVTLKLDELEVEALPANIPDHITINISSLTNLDSVISVSDLETNKNYKVLNSESEVIVSVETETVEAPETEVEITSIEGAVAPTPEVPTTK
jgi:large subunit ribosomal protein L25